MIFKRKRKRILTMAATRTVPIRRVSKRKRILTRAATERIPSRRLPKRKRILTRTAAAGLSWG